MASPSANAAGWLRLRAGQYRPRHQGAAISRFQEQEHLAQADWHVSQIRTHIVRQRIRVKHARDTGQPSQLEDSMLHALEASLYAFERHRELIVSQLKRRFSE